MNIIKSIQSFTPDFDLDRPVWARGGHAQTIGRVFLKNGPQPSYRRERIPTPDGDFVDLDRIHGLRQNPLVILFHGLEGSSSSPYAVNTMNKIKNLDWNGIVFNFRGCSGEHNRTIGSYHSGIISEIEWFLEYIEKEVDDKPVFLAGFSLGGNVLTRWLGEKGNSIPSFLTGAIAVGTPYDLLESARILDSGINRMYVWWFLRTLKRKAEFKNSQFPGVIDANRMRRARTLHEYDTAVIAPVYGFRDAEDYYRKVRSVDVLHNITLPTLLFNAQDDPFLPGNFLPRKQQLKGSSVETFFPPHGGHLGFISQSKECYMEDQIFNWFHALL